jgi:hypothetical protein
MPGRIALVLAVAAIVISVSLLAGCGADENEVNVSEGEPLELGPLHYNVVISRFLNPDDTEDKLYLVGQQPPAPDQLYLAVFMQVQNEGDDELTLPSDFTVVDTLDNRYQPVESDSDYALDLGGTIGPDEGLPLPDSAAGSGPIQGLMVLFLINDASTENRPLDLEVPSTAGGKGTVELDI